MVTGVYTNISFTCLKFNPNSDDNKYSTYTASDTKSQCSFVWKQGWNKAPTQVTIQDIYLQSLSLIPLPDLGWQDIDRMT